MSINSNNDFEKNENNKNSDLKEIDFKNIVKDFINDKSIQDSSYFDTDADTELLKSDFVLYLEKQKNSKDLLDSNKLNLKENTKLLKSQFINKKLEISSKKDLLFKYIEDDYDLLDKKDLLIEKIKGLNLENISILLSSNYARNNFLKSLNLLDKIKKNSLDKKISQIFWNLKFKELLNDKNDKDIYDSLINLLNNFWQLHFSNIESLLNKFNNEWKFYLIKYFFPVITLKDAVELGIMNSEDADVTLKKFIWSKLWINKNLTDKELKELSKIVDISNVNIDLWEFEYWDLSNFVASPTFINKLLSNFNELKIQNFIDKIENFDDFKNKLDWSFEISENLKTQFKNLKSWDYIKIRTPIKNSMNFDEEFLYVDELWEKFITYKNKIWNNILSNPKNWLKEEEKFSNLFDFLKIVSQESILVEVLDKDKFDNYLKNSNYWIIDKFESIKTKEWLKKALDWLDEKGSKIDIDKTAIEFDWKDWKRQKCYIKKIVWENVILNTNETFSFIDFIKIFTETKGSRELKQTNLDEVFEEFAKDNKSFEKYCVYKWKVILKSEKDKSNPETFQYLVSWKKALKIKNISETWIDFEIWDFAEGDILKDKKSTFKPTHSWKNFDYYEFKETLKEKDHIDLTKASFLTKSKINEWENFKEIDQKWSNFKKFMSMASISEVMMWWKHTIWAVESYLKTWNSLKAAKLARSFWKFLPASIQDELQVKVESEEKKSMETMMSNLKSKNSWDMVKAMVKILENKDSQQYEIEAALMTMVSKYWTLYNKDLKKYRWSYIWYKALWWTPWDAFYMQVKKQCEDQSLNTSWDLKNQPIPFTEEFLIESLLGQQVKPESDFYPKRRNKFDKDYWNYVSKWISEEFDDWWNKTSNQVTFKWRYDYVIWELKNWWYANWVWWIENVWWKAWNSMECNAIPFVLTYSWIANNFPQPLLKKVTWWNLWRNTPFTTLMFNKESKKIKLYQDTVKEVVKSFEDSIMLSELNNCWEDIDKLSKFWLKYWKKLDDRLTLKDWFIFGSIKSDKLPENVKKLNLDIFKEYYGFLNWIQTDWEFHLKWDFISDDKLKYEEWSYMLLSAGKPLIKSHVQFPQWMCKGEWKKIINMVVDNINALKKNKDLDINFKKEIFKTLYTYIHAAIMAQSWNYNQVLKSTQIFHLKQNGFDVAKYWIDKKELYPWDNTDDFTWYTKTPEFQEFLEQEFIKVFIENSDNKTPDKITTETKTTIWSLLNKNAD